MFCFLSISVYLLRRKIAKIIDTHTRTHTHRHALPMFISKQDKNGNVELWNFSDRWGVLHVFNLTIRDLPLFAVVVAVAVAVAVA